jgi:hypothetical protein
MISLRIWSKVSLIHNRVSHMYLSMHELMWCLPLPVYTLKRIDMPVPFVHIHSSFICQRKRKFSRHVYRYQALFVVPFNDKNAMVDGRKCRCTENQWETLHNTEMNLWSPYKVRNILTSFRRRTVLLEVRDVSSCADISIILCVLCADVEWCPILIYLLVLGLASFANWR